MTAPSSTRAFATALVAGLSLLLTGCFITPGKFTSELVLTTDDQFTFTYEGEIFFLGLSSLAQMGEGAEEFEPEDCYQDDSFETRECTQAELDEQRQVWDMNAPVRAAKAQEQAQQMSAIMGEIDPSDPEASAELVKLLSRQHGWERVEDKGNGVFDVRYSITGTLGHDFIFPLIEDFPTTNPFVQIILRDEGIARINAPGFASQNESNPMAAMMGGMVGLGGLSAMANDGANEGSQEGPQMPNFPNMEGTFTIITNGQIKANNTDEGASATVRGERLEWIINARTKTAPSALIDLSR